MQEIKITRQFGLKLEHCEYKMTFQDLVLPNQDILGVKVIQLLFIALVNRF